MNKNMTIKQLSEVLGVDQVYVAGFVKVLENQGVIKKVGKSPPNGGRGKPSDVYSIDNEVTLVFWDAEENETENVSEENKTEENPPAEIVENKVDSPAEM